MTKRTIFVHLDDVQGGDLSVSGEIAQKFPPGHIEPAEDSSSIALVLAEGDQDDFRKFRAEGPSISLLVPSLDPLSTRINS